MIFFMAALSSLTSVLNGSGGNFFLFFSATVEMQFGEEGHGSNGLFPKRKTKNGNKRT